MAGGVPGLNCHITLRYAANRSTAHSTLANVCRATPCNVSINVLDLDDLRGTASRQSVESVQTPVLCVDRQCRPLPSACENPSSIFLEKPDKSYFA